MKFRIRFKISNLNFEIDVFLFLIVILVILLGCFIEYCIIFVCMVLHELAHTITAVNLGRKIYQINIMPVGFSVFIEEKKLSLLESIAVYISGPLLNIILAIGGLIIYFTIPFEKKYLNLFIISNLYLAAFNLLPILPLDGGRIFNEILFVHLGLNRSYRLTRRVSFFLTIIILLAGIIQMAGNIFNLSLIFMGLYIIFYLRIERMGGAIMNIKYLMSRRARFIKRGIYPARDLVVLKSVRLGEVLKNLDFDRFHFIYVLDEEMKVLKVFTEQELIDKMMQHNLDTTLGELVRG